MHLQIMSPQALVGGFHPQLIVLCAAQCCKTFGHSGTAVFTWKSHVEQVRLAKKELNSLQEKFSREEVHCGYLYLKIAL